ncbi:protein FAM185A [Chelonus insularis]|uniref:protein FAM185A n=1 Tax=Chelonus insularis TaxID=460826 RepID=UPI00158DB0B3|nr:protein FAM185A-like [Chelonus insularis]
MELLTKTFIKRGWLYVKNWSYHISFMKSGSTIVRLCSSKPVNLQNITKKVDSFGKLIVDLPYNVMIKPTDPHEYSDMDTLMVKIFSRRSITKNNKNKEFISVNVSGVCKINAIDNDYNVNDLTCLIEAPVSYDIDAKTVKESDVTISGMVSNYINVQTEFGNIKGSQLQCKKIVFSSSEGGSVTLEKATQGNIEINTAKDGAVKTEKCLGNTLDISTENGDINLGSNYCEKATFTSNNGNIHLNNLHMDSTVDINGNGSLEITCLDGSLKANLQEGSTKIQIVRITDDSQLISNGPIHLTIPEDNDAKLVLNAPELDVDDKICGKYSNNHTKFIGKNEGNKFKVETTKSIQVTKASWMESLNLKKASTQKK